MRSRKPSSEGGYNGVWGGIGSKPTPKAWVPSSPIHQIDPADVPRRFRRLRLRARRVRDREAKHETLSWKEELGTGSGLVFLGLLALLATATDRIPWDFGCLLSLSAFCVGMVFVGRSVSRAMVARRPRRIVGAGAHLAVTPHTGTSRQRAWLASVQGWVVVVGGVGVWILIGLDLWGPFAPIKLAVAIALTLGVGLSLRVGEAFLPETMPQHAAYGSGRHAARAKVWSRPRQILGVATGVGLLALGLMLVRGTWGHPYATSEPFRTGLTLIMACVFGAVILSRAIPLKRRR